LITPARVLAEPRLRWSMWHNCSQALMVPLNTLPQTLIIDFQWQSSSNLTSSSSVETGEADAMKTTTKACILFCTATIQNFIQEEGEAFSVFLHLIPQIGTTTTKIQKTSISSRCHYHWKHMPKASHKSFNLLYVLKEAQLLGFCILTEILTLPPLDKSHTHPIWNYSWQTNNFIISCVIDVCMDAVQMRS
jgi:hypothetical protein